MRHKGVESEHPGWIYSIFLVCIQQEEEQLRLAPRNIDHEINDKNVKNHIGRYVEM